jgi:hypothetical protein
VISQTGAIYRVFGWGIDLAPDQRLEMVLSPAHVEVPRRDGERALYREWYRVQCLVLPSAWLALSRSETPGHMLSNPRLKNHTRRRPRCHAPRPRVAPEVSLTVVRVALSP